MLLCSLCFFFSFYVSNILWFGFRCILHCSVSLYGTEDLSRKQQHQREKKLTHVFGGKWQISPSYETAFATITNISSHLEISSFKKAHYTFLAIRSSLTDFVYRATPGRIKRIPCLRKHAFNSFLIIFSGMQKLRALLLLQLTRTLPHLKGRILCACTCVCVYIHTGEFFWSYLGGVHCFGRCQKAPQPKRPYSSNLSLCQLVSLKKYYVLRKNETIW